MEPWTPQYPVREEQARALIEAQFPDLAPARLKLLGAGFDNTAWEVNDEYVFRFPRREAAVRLLETETRLLPLLSGRLPLAVPAPAWVGSPAEDYPWLFAGHRKLPGRTACCAGLTPALRTAAAEPLGRFLRRLHEVSPGAAAANGAGIDTIRRLDLSYRIPRACTDLERQASSGWIPDPAPLRGVLDAAPDGWTARSSTLVHGDLYARHLLVDESGALTGVIDWGDVHLGDPAVDLAIAHTFLPPSAHRAFRDAYGPVDEVTWNVARLRGLWHAFMVLEYARSVGDERLARETDVALAHLASGAS